MSVTAARKLADEMCGERDIPLLVLHDFDKAGFSILATLRGDTRRYTFLNTVKVIDLGLRLADVNRLHLQAERVFDKGSRSARLDNLLQNGSTPEEAEFLLHQRVELNALTSDQLVNFIEQKLQQHGVKRIVPEKETLNETFSLFMRNQQAERMPSPLSFFSSRLNAKPPSNLSTQVRRYLEENPQARWE